MGRTIHYRIRGPRALTAYEGSALGSAMTLMNERFTWSCENLGLNFVTPMGAREPGDDGKDIRTWGFTKVADDEWNALLVVRFLIWASATLPDHTIEADDEGQYILASSLVIRGGVPHVDLPRLRRTRARNERAGSSTAWIDRAISFGVKGELFAKLPAADHCNRVPDFRELDASREELAGDVDALAVRLLRRLGLWIAVPE
jgi:hypothetical protein